MLAIKRKNFVIEKSMFKDDAEERKMNIKCAYKRKNFVIEKSTFNYDAENE